MEKKLLKQRLYASREQETAYVPSQSQRSPEKKSLGQCKVTALLVQEILGGDIIKARVDNYGFSHYRNSVDGEEIDFTYDQFVTVPIFSEKRIVAREAILDHKDTRIRYERLKDNFEKSLVGA